MTKYNNKVCSICGKSFMPTSPNQKYCSSCKQIGKRLREREYDKKRSRRKYNYKEYTRNCLICGKEFTTYYSKKLYCGSKECSDERVKVKNYNSNVNRDKVLDAERYRIYYSNNKKACKVKKALKYRELTGSTIEYKQRVYKRSYKFVSDYVSRYGYTLLTVEDDYKNTHSDIILLCPEGHEWKTTFHSFRDNGGTKGNRCIYCYLENNYTSQPEQQLLDYFTTNHPDITCIHNDRTQIAPLEIDLFFPDQKVGVEVCGLHWHSEISGGKDRKYHYNKMMRCADKNIRLITIFEDEIRDKFDIVVSRIIASLGMLTKRIYARKCDLREIPIGKANSFFEQNHIQGSSVAKKAWGLFYNEHLVAAASIGSTGRKHAGSDYVIELKRFCSLLNTSVVGGFSKLFKYIIDYVISNRYSTIKSYCDMRYGNIFNPVYESFGFELNNFTKYTPHYIKNGKRYRNISLRKTPEERLTGKTEFELRLAQGYDRIWDCGHRTYIYEI